MKLSTSESEVLKACLDYLHARGVWCWRQNQVAVHGRRFVGLKGVADILGMVPQSWCLTEAFIESASDFLDLGRMTPVITCGSLLAVECKTESGRLSPEQKQFGREVLLRGGLYVVARSITDLQEAGL